MARRLDTVVLCGYAPSLDVSDDGLDVVVARLKITDEARRLEARGRIYRRLEDFKSARSRTVRSKTNRINLRDLKRLEELAKAECAMVRFHLTLDGLESLRAENPVLHRRLQWRLPRRHLYREIALASPTDAERNDIVREIQAAISLVRTEIESENGQSPPTDYAALSFASKLLEIWSEFTGRGTSRTNRSGFEENPFGDFVEAAGKLIFKDFKGRHYARQIHEARQEVRRERRRAEQAVEVA